MYDMVGIGCGATYGSVIYVGFLMRSVQFLLMNHITRLFNITVYVYVYSFYC